LPAAGPNSCTAALSAIGVSSQTNSYNPDSVWSYEVGEKARLDDGGVTINTAIYYIRWNDVQQLVPLACGYFFTVNAGEARSYGTEIEAHANLNSEWSTDVAGGYTNAAINDPDPRLGIAPGTLLLNIPKYAASAALLYSRPLSGDLKLTARAAMSYSGSVRDEAYTYVELPSYTLVDARIGILTNRWKVYLTGSNLTNKIAELTANNTDLTFNIPSLTRFTTNQPRTIGIDASVKF
jgi:iron complex outermembrane recepter protein